MASERQPLCHRLTLTAPRTDDTRLMRARRISLIAAAMAALGCGGAAAGPAASPSPPTTFRACSPPAGVGCCNAAVRLRAAPPWARARRTSPPASSPPAPRPRPAARRGKRRQPDAVWTPSRARTAAGRTPLRSAISIDSCDDTWRGVIPPGGACQTYAACAEPAVSGGASAGASCVNSICVQVVRQPAGAACNDTMLTCDPFAGTCVSGTCTALPGPGQACTGSCSAGSRCTADVCVSLLAFGATCTSDSECQSDRCRGGRCASAFVETEYCTLP